MKYALAHEGFPVGGVRLPLVPMTPDEERKVASVLDNKTAVSA